MPQKGKVFRKRSCPICGGQLVKIDPRNPLKWVCLTCSATWRKTPRGPVVY